MFNEKLGKKEYEQRMEELDLTNSSHRKAVLERAENLQKKTSNLGLHQFQTEDCTGDHLTECKNCYQCYDGFKLEDCFYNIECNGNTASSDLTVCFETEYSYNSVQAPLNYNCSFLMHTDYCSDSEFCAYSKNLKNCFGCVYLQNKEYHILNEPYSPEDYKKEAERIKAELQAKKEYNMSLYIVSDYEKARLKNESDSVIQANLPQ